MDVRAVKFLTQLVMGWMLLASAFALAQSPSSFMDPKSGTASQVKPPEFKDIGLDQRLDQQLPLDLQFKDETGKTVRLGDYFESGRLHLPDVVRRRAVGRGQRAGNDEVHPGQSV
jgi:hypothetical protein